MSGKIVLHPRAAPGNTLRVWAGLTGHSVAPHLRWRLNGAPRPPDRVLRRLASPRTEEMLKKPDEPRVFTGVFEWTDGITPSTTYRVAARDGAGAETTLTTRTLPDTVPSGSDTWFNVLLVSCYYRKTDKSGLVGDFLGRLAPRDRPHLTVLMGDQVYLDLPFLLDLKESPSGLASRFERDYLDNWMDLEGYGRILHAAPSVGVPDDHEYWNDYPNPVKWIPILWKKDKRNTWAEAAKEMYDAFQRPYPPGGNDKAFTLDVDPLSFFFMDTRTDRTPTPERVLHPDVLDQFREWAADVETGGRFGLIVTGQPAFEEPAEKGAFDFALANYGDFGEIARLIGGIAGERPVVLMTGDKHWGRVVRAEPVTPGTGAIYEVMSSPSSLVSTPLKDQWSDVKNFIGGLFGEKKAWPRHSDPHEPPDHFAAGHLGKQFRNRSLDGLKGNHVALLSFRRHGPGLQMRATYYPLHKEKRHNEPKTADGSPYALRSVT